MQATVLYGTHESTATGAHEKGGDLRLPLAALAGATGWRLEPRGLCRGETCVPIPDARRQEWLDENEGRFNLSALARHLAQSAVHDLEHGVWSFGPPAEAGAIDLDETMRAPNFTLPDLDGRLHSLHDYRGKKVFLLAWASW